ncbi:AmpG protein [Bacteroidetes oral taxon 274 str. F0058]|nr:AmpG protein [Bacteroidetes oral taxon 274 str. F0058]
MKKQTSVWSWLPSLYFAEGIPYVIVMNLSVIMYKRLGLSNTDIAFYTGWLYLSWVIKPLWSPFVDLLKTKRWWIVSMQLLIGSGLAGVAFTLPAPFYLQVSLVLFWLMAFGSATHDIAADGFYMLALDEREQSFFVGIRNTFYRLATIFGQGALVVAAGYLERTTGNIPYAWSLTLLVAAGLFVAFSVYHRFVLPTVSDDRRDRRKSYSDTWQEFGRVVVAFFDKKNIGIAIVFMLIYRLSEAMLVKLASPFMLDARSKGGLGLSTEAVGVVYGTVGIIALIVGGILGGIAISRWGLRRCLMPMALALTLPNLVYVYMALWQPTSLVLINGAVAAEQFGYGFGFTAYMMYLIRFSEGEYKTSHYAICSGFMALGMMLPGMAAGWIQTTLGSYLSFFIFVVVCILPTIAIVPLVRSKMD